ncbi:unnamed protein product [Arabis nemorensis]|uniref:BTB domain-containing protein n=1 Tax=Arabis nemorensis TaxID=586526 RepID=A0A565BZP4_9BRAS|nr:unnamed protein product [Arabis nemorensis]
MVMESNISGSETHGDFGFAFNDANFSDRLLRIEITGSGEVSCSSVGDLVRNRKRRREDSNKEATSTAGVLDLGSYHVESNLNSENNKNNKEHEETQSGGDYENESYCKLTSPLVLRVKELHISSPILASKSPFFYKLFSNGMRESEQRHVTLSIDASEEVAVMELLNFMYTNSLSVTTAPALLDVLTVADKFEVASCMKYCCNFLLNTPMTLDFALLLLELPSSIQAAASVEPLTNAARQFIASRYKNISKVQLNELMALPLVGLEAIIASDDLQVISEDTLYELVLRWAKTHYSVSEERQEILASLANYIRFPHMSCPRLRKIWTSDDFTHPDKTRLVLEALFFKAESQHRQRSRASKKHDSLAHWYVERDYKFRPIKIVEFEIPRQQCIVYLDLSHKECAGLYPSNQLYSQAFHLGGQGFFLIADCNMKQPNSFHFGLYIAIQECGLVSLTVECEFAARSKPTEEFVGKSKMRYTFTGNISVGLRNLFAIPWESFMAKTCPYFINDVLHLRAKLSICP